MAQLKNLFDGINHCRQEEHNQVNIPEKNSKMSKPEKNNKKNEVE
ncbi:hypothetical protein DSUL_100189 [Desulfovibrionales bacterium]